MSIILRKAVKKDIPELIEMRIAYLKEDIGEDKVKEAFNLKQELNEFFEEHLNKELDAFVAEYNGEIISTSFTVYYCRLPHPRFPKGKSGIPINGYTKPEYRRKGVAGSLLKLSIEYAKERGIELLNMEVTEKGLSVSQKIGFREINYTPVQMSLK